MPQGVRLEFTDFVHGPQSFLSDDIGDFIVRRADGSAAFLFANAVDDASMGVSHVLRGEDHLTNTPRQLLILGSLGLPAPAYGHVALIVGADGAPLSKRHGAVSVREYRERGYEPQALLNHLFRLGHAPALHGLATLAEMAAAFDAAHLGRAPARFDEQQLAVWQRDVVRRLSPAAARSWLAPVLPPGLDAERRRGAGRGAAAEPDPAGGCTSVDRDCVRRAAAAHGVRRGAGARRGCGVLRRRGRCCSGPRQ